MSVVDVVISLLGPDTCTIHGSVNPRPLLILPAFKWEKKTSSPGAPRAEGNGAHEKVWLKLFAFTPCPRKAKALLL